MRGIPSTVNKAKSHVRHYFTVVYSQIFVVGVGLDDNDDVVVVVDAVAVVVVDDDDTDHCDQ